VNGINRLVHFPGELLNEVPHKQWNVPFPLAQSRHLNGKDAHPKEQIFPKFLLACHRFEIAVRRRDRTRICPQCL
jgi:hypothetical protein